MNKTERYRERLQDSKHHVRMYVDPQYFKKSEGSGKPRQQEIVVCREFNDIAIYYTKGDEYSVILNMGIPEIAADFHYQYRKLLRWAEYKGCTQAVHDDLLYAGITDLYNHIRQAVNQGAVAFETEDLLDVLPQINSGSAVSVLIYMKARCSKPTSVGGVTDLKDTTISEGLNIGRKTVYRARKLLEENGLIEELYKNQVSEDGRMVTYSKYRIKI